MELHIESQLKGFELTSYVFSVHNICEWCGIEAILMNKNSSMKFCGSLNEMNFIQKNHLYCCFMWVKCPSLTFLFSVLKFIQIPWMKIPWNINGWSESSWTFLDEWLNFHGIKFTNGTRDLQTPVATPLQPPRTLCLVIIIRNFPKITLMGPTLKHLYPQR
jgi:hypothetical protein